MEKEISSGAMLGIVLIALAAIIGIGFGIFAIAKGTANEGTTDVQDSLASVSDSYFEDFNQKTITGSNLKSCLTKLEGKPYAILVNTQSIEAKQITSSDHKSTIAFSGQDSGTHWVNFNALFSTDGTSTNIAGSSVSAKAAVYSTSTKKACTSGSTNPIGAMKDLSADNHLAFENGTYYTNYTFWTENGNVQYDTKTASVNTSGDCLEITTNSKFKANLIKDTSGKIVGIVFEQIAKKN